VFKCNLQIVLALNKLMKKIIVLLSFSIPLLLQAQTGGQAAFSFLEMSYSAKSLALGGALNSMRDGNAFLSIDNPALLTREMHHHASTNQGILPGRVNFGLLHYTRKIKENWAGAAHFRYVDYGQMTQRDETGLDYGTFHPLDMVAGISASKSLSPKFTYGFNFNFIASQLAGYSALGIGIDFGGLYFNDENNFSAGFVLKNAGYQIKGYTPGNRKALPTELQASLTKKLKFAPFRFSLLGHHLNTWDLSYFDPSATPTIDALTGDTIEVSQSSFVEKFFRHFSYQLEILLSETVNIRTGFDYNRRQEFKIETRPGAAGFSFGAGFKFKRFTFDYGISIYSRSGVQHMIGLQSDLSKWRKRT
jgi:hypothetical protein